MGASHALRRGINGHIRERLARDGVIHGPVLESERLVSYGYTNAENRSPPTMRPETSWHSTETTRVSGSTSAASPGSTMKSERWCSRGRTEIPPLGGPVRSERNAAGVEVYRAEGIELRAGDRIRWTRNDAGLGLVNSHAAEVVSVRGNRVAFRLEDGRMLELGRNDPQTDRIRPGVVTPRSRKPSLCKAFDPSHTATIEKRPVTVEMTIRFGKLFDNGPGFWVNLQRVYDLAIAERMVDVVRRFGRAEGRACACRLRRSGRQRLTLTAYVTKVAS